METKRFVVTVDSYYLRDTQVFRPEGVNHIPDAESDEHFNLYEKDHNWRNFRQDAFLGVYSWCGTELEGLKKYIATKFGLCPEILRVIEV